MNGKSNFSKGFKDGVPIGLGYLSVAFTFGIMAVRGGLSIAQAALISMTNVTSAGQLAGLELMISAAPLFEMALTQLVINLRYALMSLSLSQKMDSSMTVPRRMFFAFCNTDEVFAVASGQAGTVGISYLTGLMTAPYFGWALGTLLGAAAGSLLPELILNALGVAIYGMFIAIIIPPARKSRSVRAAVILAALLACVMRYTPCLKNISGGFAVILCAVPVSAFCAKMFPIREEGDEQ